MPSEDRSCIGAIRSLTAYITIGYSKALDFMLGSGRGVGTVNLCSMLAGTYCDRPQSSWARRMRS